MVRNEMRRRMRRMNADVLCADAKQQSGAVTMQ